MDNKLLRIAAIISGISGIVILFSVVLPIVSYQSISNQKYPDLLSPVVQSTSKATLEEVDYTKASNWFVGSKDTGFATSNISHYVISISKLGIKRAAIAIGGEDLSESLIQYPGPSCPRKVSD